MTKKILLLGSGELGKEFVIAAQRLGQHVVACDSYAGAPAMQVADECEVFDMLDGEIKPIDFAKIAEGYGAKGYTVTNEQELIDALEDSKKQTVPTLFDIKVVHGSMSDGYDSWWRVGVAEVSKSARVQAAYEDMAENIKKARLY